MTIEIAILLGLLLTALVLFARELFPMEVTAFGVLVALMLLGIISPADALAGLSNPAVVTIGMLFVLGHAVAKTGVLEVAAEKLSNMVGARQWLGVSILLVTVSLTSAFLSNTAVVAIFIPVSVNLSQRLGISASKILMPLSYAAITGGTLTLIGTSTNLIVNAFIIEQGLPPLGMFEFAPLGLVFVVTCLTYCILFARRLLPSRAGISSLTRKYHMGTYLTELKVLADSKLVGHSCMELNVNQTYDITILAVLRGGERHTVNIRNIILQPDDTLIVRGVVDSIMKMRSELGVALLSDFKLTDEELSAEEQLLAEALVTQGSRFVGRTLRQIDFRRHFGAFALAIRRHGETLRQKIADIPLRFADTLLILAPRDRLNDLRSGEELLIISEVKAALSRDRFWWVSALALPVVMILVALDVVAILPGVMAAVLLLLLIRQVAMRDVYDAVEWPVVLLLAAFVPIGMAMGTTGAADILAEAILWAAGLFSEGPNAHIVLAVMYLCTSLMTELVSNNATAIIFAPIALSIAIQLGVDPRPFLVAVAFASSAAFMTPISYQTNMMVYGPGSYRFTDYTRFGVAMNLGLWLLAVMLIPKIWPL